MFIYLYDFKIVKGCVEIKIFSNNSLSKKSFLQYFLSFKVPIDSFLDETSRVSNLGRKVSVGAIPLSSKNSSIRSKVIDWDSEIPLLNLLNFFSKEVFILKLSYRSFHILYSFFLNFFIISDFKIRKFASQKKL